MENNQKEIIDIALDRLNQEGLWFTTKEDKLYANAKDLYKLDKFGELEDKSKERLIAEVESYLGDGATFIIEAVDQWIEDNIAEGLLGYVDTLAMDFEIPEAVEDTNSYSEQGVDNLETTVAKEADKAKKEEGKKIVGDNDRDFGVYQQYIMSNVYCDNETMMTSPEIIEDNAGLIAEDAAKEVVAQIFDGKEPEGIYQATLEDYTKEIKRVILANIDRIVHLQNTEQEELNAKLTEAKADGYSKPVKVDGKWFRYNYKYNELEYITHSSNEFGPIEVIDSIGVNPEDWKEDKDLCIQRFLEDIKLEEDVDDLKTDEEPKEEELGAEVKLEESKDEKLEEANTFDIAEDMYNRTHKDKWHTLSDDEKAEYYNKNYKRIEKQANSLDKKTENEKLEEAKYLVITRDKDYISNKKNIKELTATYGKGKFQIYDSNGTLIHPEGIYDGEDRIWASTFIKTHKVGDEVPDAADWYYHEYEPKEEKQMSESKKITESRKASEKKTLKENARKRLDERNEQSADIIEKALAGITSDTNEKESGIINKTSEIFNELSKKNYDVQVAFDNGESQLQIDMGQQGASAMITITDANQPIRTFISGNFELTDENIRAIQDLKEVLS